MLAISLFGAVRVVRECAPPVALTRGVQGLLAYLALFRGRLHPREVLRGVFWGDEQEEHARHCLNTALWRLRRILEPAGVGRGSYLLTTRAGEVGFNSASDHWIDAAAFEATVGKVVDDTSGALAPAQVAELQSALELYRGDLLESFFDDWALRERERLRMLYVHGLDRLMHHHGERSEWDAAAACGRRILELDPLREEVHRDLMRTYARSGQRCLAARQFELCRDLLMRELGIPPMPETLALYHTVVDGESGGAAAPTAAPPARPILLHLAVRRLDQAKRDIRRALRLLEQPTGTPPKPGTPPDK